MKITDGSYFIGSRGHGRGIERHIKFNYDDGHVATQYGYVAIYAQGSDSESRFTTLRFIVDGTEYRRKFHGKRFIPRGIVTKAIEFAREICEGEVNE